MKLSKRIYCSLTHFGSLLFRTPSPPLPVHAMENKLTPVIKIIRASCDTESPQQAQTSHSIFTTYRVTPVTQ